MNQSGLPDQLVCTERKKLSYLYKIRGNQDLAVNPLMKLKIAKMFHFCHFNANFAKKILEAIVLHAM
jgi:hypothetical protein